MEKARVQMANWSLYRYYNTELESYTYNLSGEATGHPVLGNTKVARTSYLVSASIEDNILYYETENTMYVCPLKYMAVPDYKTNLEQYIKEKHQHKFGVNTALDKLYNYYLKMGLSEEERKSAEVEITPFDIELDSAIKIGQEELKVNKEANKKRLLAEVAKRPGSLYMEVTSISSGSDIAYNIKAEDGEYHTGISNPYIHVGMFQDSILYGKDGMYDFRYFPGYDSIQTYAWSDNIERVIVKNMKNRPIRFNDEIIHEQETKEFVRN